ncbi:Alpha-tubulin suppressor [Myxococcus fulvus]|uniref:Alpha-tubulin suppressor n=1 Tax=Myxococcus fulvus TaxID=33 RepID=A0ABY1CTX1_MYXFU|nr:Alpha-tubulin suppressor [Myxococcus fulvus]
MALLSCGEPESLSDNGSETTTTKKKLSSQVPVDRAVAGGTYHSLFLQRNGEVYSWGQNLAGQLGTGSINNTPVASPTKPVGLPRIKAIAAGQTHSLALDMDGRVWAWGKNDFGQLGLGATGGLVTVPTRVSGLSSIQAISANGNFSLALGQDGRVWAWGQNASGQVGAGAVSTAESTPRQVNSLPTIRAIAAGHNHALALDADGKVWGWGRNDFGQVGTGTAGGTVLTPSMMATLSGIKAIAAGAAHSLAIDEQFGNVWGWGQNSSGQVGTGTTSTAPVLQPTAVSGVFAATRVSAGHAFSLVIMGNGIVKAWGLNASGQLGYGTPGGTSGAPVDVVGLQDVTAIAAGYHHVLAVRSGCPVWTWGNNSQGQLGTGTYVTTPTSSPVTTSLVNTYYFDSDMDGFGDELFSAEACEAPYGYVEDIDCNDFDSATYPGALETCNGTDDNCDSEVDEGNPSGGDECSTGLVGVCAKGTTACTQGSVVCAQNQAASSEQCDGLDNDCDGEVDDGNPGGLVACETGGVGVCGEGVKYCTHGALECVQRDAPSAEVCDNRDNDCNGQTDDGLTFATWYLDQDHDDYGIASQSLQACARPTNHAAQAGDCDDTRATFNPGAPESCDGLDNNCDGQVDEGLTRQTWYRDADGDGFGVASDTGNDCRQPAGYVAVAGDCNDGSASIKPGAAEVCDGADNDCDALTDEGVLGTYYRDADGDGYGSASQTTQACSTPTGYVTNTTDCLDTDATIHPGATEVCDGLDNNCAGGADEGVPTQEWFLDGDGDGHGRATLSTRSCRQPTGYVSSATDCDDANPTTYPGATEVCDGVDNNCSGGADEGLTTQTWYRDVDGDGSGNTSVSTQSCRQPSGYVGNASDCNDSNSSIRPGASETCDSVDNNCDGSIDEGVTSTFYRDADGDGHGNASNSIRACSVPPSYVANATDCNDGSASIHPGASEICDGLDNNCAGGVDEGLTTQTWYRDADGDGYGNTSISTQNCRQPSGYVSNTSDCNDSSANIRPGASETCDSVDNNCNGSVDEGVTSTWYRDVDGDGYGSASTSTQACSKPTGYVSNATDCNDGSASIHPGATEVCDGVDNNCAGGADEGLTTQTWYRDADSDGYGSSSSSTQNCRQPSGYVSNASDCNDGSTSIRPGASETCDSVDNNCNGSVDEGVTSTWYRDVDGDGYGSASTSTQACSKPTGYVSNATDCNDGSASIHPGATEVCDGVDNNCAGGADEGLTTQTWYRDADSDGHGSSSNSTQNCRQPSGYVSNASDCNDGSASIRPGASETCDSVDNNCNGSVDEGVMSTWYRDTDGDGYGYSTNTTQACASPAGYVANSTDCHDGNATVYPGASEVCDSLDNNCNGSADEGVTVPTWYRDADGDGYGTTSLSTKSCGKPVGYVADATDCNDASPYINPGRTDVCFDRIDNDCSGWRDDDCPLCPEPNDLNFSSAEGFSTLVDCDPFKAPDLVSEEVQ